jgi:serine phosphatase RsbU (regulator of sigma subunit)
MLHTVTGNLPAFAIPRSLPWAVLGGNEVAPWVLITALLIFLCGVFYYAYKLGQQRILKQNRHLIETGRWTWRQLKQSQIGVPPVIGSPTEMQARLDRWLAQMEKDAAYIAPDINEEMQVDLELAKDFQLAYLNRPYPKIPEMHFEGRIRLEFCHWYQPALALGGDFFDIIPLASDTAGVFVADVMGHGARSALITAILRTLLRDLKGQGRNARHYITEVNKAMCEIMRGFPQPLFASAFYFVPDTTSRVATYSTAGHPPPFHVRRSVGRLMRLTVPSPHGAALGIIPKEEYTGGHVRLIDNDSFILYTDGVYEATNRRGEEFGLVRMEEIIRKNMYKPAALIVDALKQAIHDFVGDHPLADDICIVGIEVTTKEEKTEDAAVLDNAQPEG